MQDLTPRNSAQINLRRIALMTNMIEIYPSRFFAIFFRAVLQRTTLVSGALLAIGILLCTGASAAVPNDRSMFWPALDVTAHLDDKGQLHVIERQTMVFDGAWNGGERRFRVRNGQHLQLLGVTRIDAAGTRHALRAGNLSNVDEYRLFDSDVLRWRSRLPSDPPFRNTERVYEISYVLSGILQRSNGQYALDHDFAFPDRPGVIKRFTLALSFDSAWRPPAQFDGEIVRQHLAPGQSVIVALPLGVDGTVALDESAFTSNGGDAATLPPFPLNYPDVPAWRFFLILGLLGFSVWCVGGFLRHEIQRGRFDSPPDSIDELWLDQHIFSLPPEVIGAAWDYRTDAAEVTAVLARMVLEGKIRSKVRRSGFWFWRRDVLYLELTCDRTSLVGYEARLARAIFFDSDTTDTDRIRKHYKKQGFDPAQLVKAPLKKKVARLLRQSDVAPAWQKRLAVSMFVVGSVMCGLAVWLDENARILVAIVWGGALIFYGYGRIAAKMYESQVVHLFRHAITPMLMFAAMVVAVVFLLMDSRFGLGIWAETALTLVIAGLVDSAFRSMRSPDTVETTRTRKGFAAAREFFVRELQSAQPRLRDAWLPYILAFGLAPCVDRWFRAYGLTVGSPAPSWSGGSSSRMSAGSWTGGGGAFGGGGASGAWATAVAGIAAGVAAPSSGGSGSGGGGSSGGGGGGGW